MADISQVKLPGDLTSKNIKALKLPYGECSTAADESTKIVTIKTDNGSSGNNMPFILEKGTIVLVNFQNTNTVTENLKMNVNSSGAKPIRYRGEIFLYPYDLGANRTYLFVYDGTNWVLTGDLTTSFAKNVGTSLLNIDLNTILAPGVYYSGDSASTATLTNKPSDLSYGFKMYVFTIYGLTRLHQIIESRYNFYYRYYNGTTWDPWKKNAYITGEGILSATTFSGELNGTISSSTTATTQSQGDNSTKVATTAYVDAAVPTPAVSGTILYLNSADVPS